MDQTEIDNLYRLMEFEAARTEPPAGFPVLPDIPAGRYTDERFYRLEQEHIWRKSWLLAGHIDEIPEPGCFRLWDNAGQPVILVHSPNGEVNAFYNTCSHRGAPVVTEKSGKRARLTCAYHGWSYTHDGDLIGLRDPEDFNGLVKSERSLKSIRCERFGNLIFVNFDPAAPALLEWLGPIADEWKEFQFENCRLTGRHIFDLNCNWKVAMEANTEVYHVKSIHAQTVAQTLDDRRNVNTFYPNGHGRMVAPTFQDRQEMRLSRYPEGMKEIASVGPIGRTCTQSYGVFPNWVSPLSHFTLPPLLFWPNGINKCRLETWTMIADWGDGKKPDFGNMWTNEDDSDLGAVLLEDTQFGEAIQKSMESYGFDGVPLSYQEARIYHWNQFADKLIGVDNIPEELRVVQVIGDEWMYPNDPRLAQLNEVSAG